MDFKVLLWPEAETDLDNAFEWYENQCKGLGKRMYMSYKEVREFLKQNPKMFPHHNDLYRKASTRGFPFGIFYALNEAREEVVIAAVWHNSRSPEKLEKRLSLK